MQFFVGDEDRGRCEEYILPSCDGVSWRTMCRDDDRKRARTDDDRGGHHRKQRAGSCSSATSGDSEAVSYTHLTLPTKA